MIRICAWCEREGKLAFMGEIEPLTDKSETHGVCEYHAVVVREEQTALPLRTAPCPSAVHLH